MTAEKIIQNLETALKQLVKDDYHLLEHSLSERSIAHRLAIYLEPLFNTYNVDCEYNGDVDNLDRHRKRIQLNDRERDELIDESKRSEDWISVYPDIIVHKRGSNKDNLLCIEIKKNDSTSRLAKFDHDKLNAFVRPRERDGYGYILGVFIDISTKKGRREIGNYDLTIFSYAQV